MNSIKSCFFFERPNSRSDVSCISGSIAHLQCFSLNTRCFPKSMLMVSLFLVPYRNTKAFFCYPVATPKLKSWCSLLYGLEYLGTFWPQPYSWIILQKNVACVQVLYWNESSNSYSQATTGNFVGEACSQSTIPGRFFMSQQEDSLVLSLPWTSNIVTLSLVLSQASSPFCSFVESLDGLWMWLIHCCDFVC